MLKSKSLHDTLDRLDRIDAAAKNGVYTVPCINKKEVNREMKIFIAKTKVNN